MLETTNTSRPFILTVTGRRKFTIKTLPLKRVTKSGKGVYFEFKFAYEIDGERKTHTEFLMPWQLKEMLSALGFQEVDKDKFEWDREQCVGRSVLATIVHEPDRKDPDKLRSRMVEIEKVDDTEVPF